MIISDISTDDQHSKILTGEDYLNHRHKIRRISNLRVLKLGLENGISYFKHQLNQANKPGETHPEFPLKELLYCDEYLIISNVDLSFLADFLLKKDPFKIKMGLYLLINNFNISMSIGELRFLIDKEYDFYETEESITFTYSIIYVRKEKVKNWESFEKDFIKYFNPDFQKIFSLMIKDNRWAVANKLLENNKIDLEKVECFSSDLKISVCKPHTESINLEPRDILSLIQTIIKRSGCHLNNGKQNVIALLKRESFHEPSQTI